MSDSNCFVFGVFLQGAEVQHFMMDVGLNWYSIYLDCAGGIPPHLERYLVDMKNLLWSPKSNVTKKYQWHKKVGTDL